jgi:hypothetical protein
MIARLGLAILCLLAACRRPGPLPTSRTDAAPRPAASLLGGERGLDHVNLATAELATVLRTLEGLGFAPPIRGRMPNGLENANYYFEDATYLEVLSATDPKQTPWVPRFLARGPGLMKLVLVVRSVEESATFLRGRGVPTLAPTGGTIRTEGAPTRGRGELWRKLLFTRTPLPCDCLFLIAYEPSDRAAVLRKVEEGSLRRRFSHPNTARGLRAVSWAVRDLDAAARSFERIGLRVGAAFPEPRLDATARRVEVGAGAILLLAPSAANGAVARYLAARGGPGLLGASIAVRELATARRQAELRTGRSFAEKRGPLGRAILIPPELAHGAWLELCESR